MAIFKRIADRVDVIRRDGVVVDTYVKDGLTIEREDSLTILKAVLEFDPDTIDSATLAQLRPILKGMVLALRAIVLFEAGEHNLV